MMICMWNDQKICYEPGKTFCRFQINKLSQKIRSFKPGECADLKPFFAHDGKTQFLLRVYPNGNREENRGHISIILENVSDKPVFCDFEIKISSSQLHESIVFKDKEMYFKSPSIFNFPRRSEGDKILEHKTLMTWDNFDINHLKIYCSISRLFTDNDENVQENSPKAPSLGFQSKLSSVESKMSELMIKLEEQEKEKTRHNNIPVPECPVCFEPLNKSPKIAQCVLGHLLCWNCKQRPELEDCPSCKGPICGRAFGMENYLKTLFPTPGEFQFLADKGGAGAVVNVDESRIGG